MDKKALDSRISELELELSNLKRIQKAGFEEKGSITPDRERIQVDETMEIAKSFLDSIIEHSPTSLWISDEHGTLIRMNKACREILKLKDEEVVGKYNILKDTNLEIQGIMPQVRDVFEKGKEAHFSISYDTSAVSNLNLENAVKLYLHVNISPIVDSNGKVTNAIIQHIDITQRKLAEDALAKSEEKYRKALLEANRFAEIMDNIPGYIYIKNTKHEYVYANRHTLEFFKGSKEKLPYIYDVEVFPKQTVKRLWEIDDKVIFSGTATSEEIETLDAYNIPTYYWEIKYPLFDEKGKVWGLCGISIDISELKRTEKALKESEEKLKKLNSDKDRFISILAHDLIGPFSPILGLLGLLSQNLHKYDTEKIQKLINTVNESALKVYGLLEETLIWANAQSGKLPFEPEMLHFSAVCEDITEILKPNYTKKNISVEYTRENIEVFADRNMLKVILRNLVSNAIKFTNEDGFINILAERTPKEVIVTVSDTGIGISKENIKKLLNNSHIHTTEGTAREKGSGLGLIICKEFVERHGGVLWVESEIEKGSKFKFTLPNH